MSLKTKHLADEGECCLSNASETSLNQIVSLLKAQSDIFTDFLKIFTDEEIEEIEEIEENANNVENDVEDDVIETIEEDYVFFNEKLVDESINSFIKDEFGIEDDSLPTVQNAKKTLKQYVNYLTTTFLDRVKD